MVLNESLSVLVYYLELEDVTSSSELQNEICCVISNASKISEKSNGRIKYE